MACDVFISYAHEDKSTADQVCGALEDAGHRCWIAPRDIMPGMDWAEAIVDGVAQCRVLLLLLSSHSNNSQHVERELEKAVNDRIPIVPVRTEDVEPSKAVSYYLGAHQWLDAFAEPPAVYPGRLVAVVGRLLAGGEAPPAIEHGPPMEERPPVEVLPPVQETPPTTTRPSPGRWLGWVAVVVVAAIVTIVALVAVVSAINQGSDRPSPGGAVAVPSEPPVAEGPSDEEAIRQVVEEWRSAWEEGRLGGFMELYHQDFYGEGMNREQWGEDRRISFERCPQRSVELGALQISVDGDEGRVECRQLYRGVRPDGSVYESTGRKTLDLVKTAEGWRIIGEGFEKEE